MRVALAGKDAWVAHTFSTECLCVVEPMFAHAPPVVVVFLAGCMITMLCPGLRSADVAVVASNCPLNC